LAVISGQKRTTNAKMITRHSMMIGVITHGRLALLTFGLDRALVVDLTLGTALTWEIDGSPAEISRVAGIRLVPQ